MLQAISGCAAAAAAAAAADDDDGDDHMHNVRMNAPRGINSGESGITFDSECVKSGLHFIVSVRCKRTHPIVTANVRSILSFIYSSSSSFSSSSSPRPHFPSSFSIFHRTL